MGKEVQFNAFPINVTQEKQVLDLFLLFKRRRESSVDLLCGCFLSPPI